MVGLAEAILRVSLPMMGRRRGLRYEVAKGEAYHEAETNTEKDSKQI